MPSNGWARLRPVNADLRRVVMILTLLVSALFVVAGGWSIANFFRFDNRRDGINFTIFVYVVVFGVLLIFGEVGWPVAIFDFFGFLASSAGRAFFLFFASTLAASSGWSGDRNRGSNILLIISGITGIVVSFLGLCYGHDHYGGDSGGPRGGDAAPNYASNAAGGAGARSGGGVASFFGRSKNTQGPTPTGPEAII